MCHRQAQDLKRKKGPFPGAIRVVVCGGSSKGPVLAWDSSSQSGWRMELKEERAAQAWQSQQSQITADTGTNLVMCRTGE